MTVKQLIVQLQRQRPELEVRVLVVDVTDAADPLERYQLVGA